MEGWSDLGPGVLAIALLGVLLATGEIGSRIARRASAPDEKLQGQLSTVQAAVLALLGLLLAFTFSMSAARYEHRRELVIEESNAIGTVWLRTDALPEPVRDEAHALIRRYVDAQLAFYAAAEDPERLSLSIDDSERLQDQLWSIGMVAALAEPTSQPRGLLLEALNAMIDLQSARVTAKDAHVPGSVALLLAVVSAIAVGTVGYTFGLARLRHLGAATLLSVLVAAIVFVILDLDEPRRGLIRVSQASMVRLRESIDAGG